MFQFPKDDLDTPKKAESLIGGYWVEVYAGKDQIEDLLSSRATLWQQARDTWNEVYRTKSRHLIDPLAVKNWMYFPILKSTGVALTKLLGGGGSYGDSAFNYGETDGYAWDLPKGVLSLSQIYNRISDPSASLIEGIDFYVDDKIGKIVFSVDPFSNPKFAITPVNNRDGAEDTLLALWIYRPKIDNQSIQLIYGQPIGVDGKSSQEYKQFVNVVYDSLILGMSSGRLGRVIGGAMGLPVAVEDEIVERVYAQIRKVIVTDKRVYFVPEAAEITVEVDDLLVKGQSMTDALIIRELKRNSDISEVAAVNLSSGFISNDFAYDLGFVNKYVDTSIVTDSEGYTELKFDIGGHPLDVERFWEIVHERGISKGRTIAQGLDKRAEKVGEPASESLPEVINPLRFLVDEMIPGGFTLITIKVEAVSPGLLKTSILPDLMSLGNGIFFIFEAPLAIDGSLDVQSVNDSKFTGAETVEEYIPSNLLNSAVTLKSINSSCE